MGKDRQDSPGRESDSHHGKVREKKLKV